MLYRGITACRSCGSGKLETVLDLGELCISDFLAPCEVESEDRAPLELVVCLDCSLVQLSHTVDRDRLYRDYWYRSGTNESMVAALRDVVEDACRRVELKPGDIVLDIGCNDGTMLRMFPKDVYRMGFEPSNLAQGAPTERGMYVHKCYFPPVMPPDAPPMGGLPGCKIITSIAMFYDIDDPNGFVSAIRDWLHPDGIWVVQFQDLQAMVKCNGFDNICHEHLTYWSHFAFEQLVARHGLRIDDYSYNATNGGSVRYIVRHGQQEPEPRRFGEAFGHAFELMTFGKRVEKLKEHTVSLLWDFSIKGKKVLGYGASTKGNTLLQYYGIGPDLIPAIAERAPEKYGRLTVGTHIPIISEAEMREQKPDYLFVLPWHFIDGFVKREREFLEAGGKFIVPLPELRIVGVESCRSIPVGYSERALAGTI